MKFPLLLVLLAAAAMPLAAGTQSVPVGPNPESVARGWRDRIFVSVMGETREDGDGNGRIVVVENGSARVFTGGLDDPKGLAFTGDYLVTADFTRVWKIDSTGRKSLLAAPDDFPAPPLYLNDVAVAPEGQAVLVSDFGARDRIMGPDGLWPLDSEKGRAVPAAGRVYRITLDGRVTTAVEPHLLMPCPNGVDVLSDGRIRIAEFFTGVLLEFGATGGQPRVLARGFRSADGIAHDTRGNIYVSEFLSGRVLRVGSGGDVTSLSEGLQSAADFLLEEERQQLIVPDSKAGTLVFIPLED